MTLTAEQSALVEQYVPLVYSCFKRTFPFHREDHDDLISEGFKGLIGAATNFDATRGVHFTTFAIPRIVGAMKDYLRRTNLAGNRKDERLKPQAMAFSIEKAREVQRDWDIEGDESPEESLVEQDTKQNAIIALREALNDLPPREKQVIIDHYVHEHTYTECASVIGVSESRANQIAHRGLRRLKVALS